jgi:chromate reductase, NAD(P)H dehydrogenase (quinone)
MPTESAIPTSTPTTRPILILSGTNRPGSNALRISNILAELYARAGVHVEVLSLTDLGPEIFLPSSYAAKPPAMVALQQRILNAAGLHLVTPEYNGSFPGVLKYFIDLLKFPESFEHKPVAFVGEANGAWGGLRAVEQLQMVFAYRNAHLYPRRVFISAVKEKFDAEGKLNDPELMKRLEEQCAGFAKFVGAVS